MQHSARGGRFERGADDTFDFIELTNIARLPVDLGGVRLTHTVEIRH